MYDDEYARLAWDAVDGASYYIIEQTYNGVTEEIMQGNAYYGGIISGATYRVRALPKDQENDRSSSWSESFTVSEK